MAVDDDDASDPIGLGAAVVALIVGAGAWTPTLAAVGGLAYALADTDGFGCSWIDTGKPASMAAILVVVPAAFAGTVLGLFALIRTLRSPSIGRLGTAVAGFALSLSAMPGPFTALWLNAVLDDNLCWSRWAVYGRVLRDRGRPVVAATAAGDGWCGAIAPARVDPAVRDARIDAWTAMAVAEHASIAAFDLLALDLLAHGAPAALVRGAHAAALDEIGHAEVGFAVASAYAGRPIGPEGLALPRRDGRTPLERLAVETFLDGMIGEGLSAEILAASAARATDPAIAAVLARIAVDERAHRDLAARIVAWAIAVGGEPVRDALAGARIPRPPVAPALTDPVPPGRIADLHAAVVAGALRAIGASSTS